MAPPKRTLTDRLRSVLEEVTALPKPGPESSPGTKGRYQRVNRYVDQLAEATADLRGDNEEMPEENEPEEHEDGGTPAADNDEKVLTSTKKLIAQRTKDIMPSLQEDTLDPAETVRRLCQNLLVSTHRQVEDQALKDLLRCFDPTRSNAAWELACKSATLAGPGTFETIIDEADARDREQIGRGRMVHRYKFIQNLGTDIQTRAWSSHIFTMTESIKFMSDFDQTLAGKKKEIGRFYSEAFQQARENLASFSGLSPDARRKKMYEGDVQKRYNAWKRAGERQVTNMHTLFRAYHSFGPAVFLNSTWVPSNGRTPEFHRVVNSVISELGVNPDYPENEESNELGPYQEDNIRSLRFAVEQLGGAPVVEYLNQFLEAYPSHVAE